MKFIGIVGSIFENSLNKKLLEFTKFKFSDIAEIEIVDISEIPIFSQELHHEDYPKLKEISDKIIASDGVIIATPEHNYTIPVVLKSLMEWLSYELHPFEGKPIMIIGASYKDQGSARAQSHLKSILDSPGVDAYIMPGNEFLISYANTIFDEDGYITDEKTVDFLEHQLIRFTKYAEVIKQLDLKSVESNFTRTMESGGYEDNNDPYDGTTGASEY